MEINWGLLQPVDIGGEFQQGLERGRKFARERAVEGALRDIADTGIGGIGGDTDPAAAERRRRAEGVLAAYAPDRLATIETLRTNRLKTQQAIADNQRAVALGELATRDPMGAANEALAAGDIDLARTFQTMGKDQREAAVKRAQAAAPIAYQALKMPPEQRTAFIASNRDFLIASGWAPEQIDNFQPTDEALGSLVTSASTLEQLRANDKVDYRVLPEGAKFVPFNSFGRPATADGSVPSGAPVGALGPGAAAPAPSGGGGLSIDARNNPGALRVPGSMEFQTFRTPQEGMQAQERQLGRYFNRGLRTVSSVVETYAPRSSRGGDNSDEQVNNYISYVSQRLGVNPQDALSPGMVPKLAEAMREFETGRRKPSGSGKTNDAAKVKADAQAAIAAGADPVKVKQRAAEMGVTL